MYGDAVSLQCALETLDEYTIVSMRGSEEHAEEDLMLVSRALHKRAPGKGARTGTLSGQRSLDSDAGNGTRAHSPMAIVSQVMDGMQARPPPQRSVLSASVLFARECRICCAPWCLRRGTDAANPVGIPRGG
jgi:hypothetical protein